MISLLTSISDEYSNRPLTNIRDVRWSMHRPRSKTSNIIVYTHPVANLPHLYYHSVKSLAVAYWDWARIHIGIHITVFHLYWSYLLWLSCAKSNSISLLQTHTLKIETRFFNFQSFRLDSNLNKIAKGCRVHASPSNRAVTSLSSHTTIRKLTQHPCLLATMGTEEIYLFAVVDVFGNFSTSPLKNFSTHPSIIWKYGNVYAIVL